MYRPLSLIAIVVVVPWSTGCASVSSRAGATPVMEVNVGFTAPQLPQAEFPGFAGAITYMLPRTSTWGLGLVADADASYLVTSTTAGVRVYARTSPLYGGHRALSYFGQLLLGKATGSVSGVLRSEAGAVIEPNAGLDYGSGRQSFHLQVGYRRVANGKVYDSRVPGAPIDQLSGPRVVVGMTWRILPR